MKNKFIFIKITNKLLPIIFVCFTICLILFSSTNLIAAKNGLNLWATCIVPSLFPFFVATELLSQTCIINILGNTFNKFMKPLFNVPGEGSFALIMGIISGYPTGAKIITNFLENGKCTIEEAERLLAFTNNSGPLFIIGTIGVSLFCSTEIGFILLTTHILACITVGLIFKFWKYNKKSNTHITKNIKTNSTITLSNLGEILSNAISKSIKTIMIIGGFVVLFSVIISILEKSNILFFICNIFKLFNISPEYIHGFFIGMLELTNGAKYIANIPSKTISNNIIICSFLTGFGGISVLLQVYSIIHKYNISIKPYLYGKLLQAFFSSIYTFLILQINFFNLNLI